MKITRHQLRKIIAEAIDPRELEEPLGGWAGNALHNDPDYKHHTDTDASPHGDEEEYERGYQDGFDSAPPASNATADYDIGYEDGEGDATLPEPDEGRLNENSRPWGTYSTKKDDYFSDTIVMSPNGDSMLVDGLETYVQDVPSQLEYASGFPVPDIIGDVIMAELQNQEQSGYVEVGVEYKNGEWTGSWV
jgi:hypothetical protein